MTAPRQTAIAPVYPRWRGEHLWITLQILVTCGLSPLARGTQVVAVVDGVAVRFIPAGAGNTRVSRNELVDKAVYPRWRGEHPARTSTPLIMRGLSPLARGTRNGSNKKRQSERFIPAGAGNTHAGSVP
ncbi:CRISPR associated protein of unknown function [Salmonella enterica subsp. enterica serovar Virchow]|nr:CRISPR associated protein of unknown function [Salmonella enterica subsp. enterica serovar Virchow]